MVEFGRADALAGARFEGVDLRGARFVESELSGVVMRGVGVRDMEIDAPWLYEERGLRVNGVEVTGFVEAELNRRFPGRAERHAADPEGLRAAWAMVEGAWAATMERAAAMPAGTVEVRVDGEWSFSQTLRHLVFATDVWLGRAILEREQPFHALGQPHVGPGTEVPFTVAEAPAYAEVLVARADRVAMVRDFLAGVTPEVLSEPRPNPHRAEFPETVLSCLHTILEEEWEHHRFAVRDLDAIAAENGA